MIVGRVLFEVILAVATDAIASVAKEIVKVGAELAGRALRSAVELFQTLRRLLGGLLEGLSRLGGRITGKLGEVLKEAAGFLLRLGTLFDELAGEGALVADTGTGLRVPIPEAKGPTVLEARALKPPGGTDAPKASELIPEKGHPTNVAPESARPSTIRIPDPEASLSPELLAKRRKILESLENFINSDEALRGVKTFEPNARFEYRASSFGAPSEIQGRPLLATLQSRRVRPGSVRNQREAPANRQSLSLASCARQVVSTIRRSSRRVETRWERLLCEDIPPG